MATTFVRFVFRDALKTLGFFPRSTLCWACLNTKPSFPLLRLKINKRTKLVDLKMFKNVKLLSSPVKKASNVLMVSFGLFGNKINRPFALLSLSFAFAFKACHVRCEATLHNTPSLNLPQNQPNSIKGYLYGAINSLWYFLLLLARGVHLSMLFGPVLILYPFMSWNERLKRTWWKLVLFCTNNAGPICMKFAQWASTRRDLFSPDFCDNFSRLQRKTNPHSWKFTKHRLEKAFGKKWREVFVKFDNERRPVGSGCVAQVYKAYMKAEYIDDPQVLNELVEENQSEDDSSFDFFEGAEVIGFGHLFGTKDEELDYAEKKRREWKIDKEKERLKIEHDQLDIVECDDHEEDEFLIYSKSLLDDRLSKIDDLNEDDLEGLVPVAIKVLHPNIRFQFKRDLAIIRTLANLVSFVRPNNVVWWNVCRCMDVFEKTMSDQLNLKLEAKKMDCFRSNFSNISNVRFACPIWPYVSPNVLVESYEEAEPLCSFLSSEEGCFEGCEATVNCELKARIAQIGFHALLKMIFEDNLAHGDLHPGNILVQNYEPYGGDESRNNDENIVMLDVCDTLIVKPKVDKYEQLRILILDCGISSSLSNKDLDELKKLFAAVVRGKSDQVANLFILDSNGSMCKNPDEFRQSIGKIIQNAHEQRLSLEKTDVGQLLSELFELLQKHNIKLESSFASIMLAILVIEGVGRTLDPGVDIVEIAKSYVF